MECDGWRGVPQHCFILRKHPYNRPQYHLGAEYADCGGLYIREVWPAEETGEDKGDGLYHWFHMGKKSRGGV